MSPTRRRVLGTLAIVVAATCFGTLGTLSRLAYDAGMTPLGFATWRAFFGAILLTIVVVALARRGRPMVRLRDVRRQAVGALAVAAAAGIILNLAVFIAFGRITVALALLAFYTYPAMVAVVAIVIERRRPDRLELLALGLALGGMILVVAGQLEPGAGLVIDGLGLGLALLAAVAQTVYITTSRGYAAIPTEQAAPILLWVAALAFIVIAALSGSLDSLGEPLRNPAAWPYLLVAGLLGAGVPSLLFLVAIRLIGPVRTGILAMLEPVTGTVLAALILGETLGPIQLVGGALVIAAGVLLQGAPTPAGAPPTHPSQVPAPG
ncbi:MAG TPA: DMT family transporter [Candidatus Limnocylindrales bacterium]